MKKVLRAVPSENLNEAREISTKKREVPHLSAARKKLFSSIENSPAFGKEAFLARYSFLKKD